MSLPILCYHKVGPQAQEGKWLNVSPERLREHIRFFLRRNHQFVLGRELAGAWPARGVCLTFDDAYASTLSHGVETMLSAGVRATIYVVSQFVGDASRWDGEKAAPIAAWDVLLEAASKGFELGAHTASHPHLDQFDPDGQAKEVRECARELRAHGQTDFSFCYPYGAFNAQTVSVLKEEGFRVAMALGKRPARLTDPLLRLPRIVMGFSDSPALLLYKLYLKPKLRRLSAA